MRTLPITLIAALIAVLATACADELPSAPPQPAFAELSELDQAAAKLEEWLAHLRSVRLEISATTNINAEREDNMARVSATAMITADRFYFSTWVRNRQMPDPPGLHFETLVASDVAYSRRYDIDGWLRSPLTDLDRRILGVVAPGEISAADWSELESASIARADQDGRPVWLVEYTADRADLARFPDLVPALTTGAIGASTAAAISDPLSAAVRLWIDRENGALLRAEITQRLNTSGSGQDFAIASTIELAAWNSPLDIPTPEPALNEAEYRALLESSRSTGAPNVNTAQILYRTRNEWFTDGREAVARQRAVITLNDAERQVANDKTVTAADQALPLAVLELHSSNSAYSWRGSSGSSNTNRRTTLGLSLSREAVRAHRDLLITALQAQLDDLLEAPPTVERVLYFDLSACFDPDTGQLFEGEIAAAALTSAGQLELQSAIKVGPASPYASCHDLG